MDDKVKCEVTVTLIKSEQVKCPECETVNACEPDVWARTVSGQFCTCGECGQATRKDRWRVIDG